MTSKKRTHISDSYCEVCGFGFLIGPDQVRLNVTCLQFGTYKEAVAAGAVHGVPSTSVASPARNFKAAPSPSPEEEQKAPTSGSSASDRILEALRKENRIGKSRILELSGIPVGDYLGAIQDLLTKGKITKTGEKSATRYHLADGTSLVPEAPPVVPEAPPVVPEAPPVVPEALPVVPEAPPVVPAEAAQDQDAEPVSPSDLILNAIRKDAGDEGVNKGRILESSGVSEADYTVGIEWLIASGEIIREGRGRGTRYKVAP